MVNRWAIQSGFAGKNRQAVNGPESQTVENKALLGLHHLITPPSAPCHQGATTAVNLVMILVRSETKEGTAEDAGNVDRNVLATVSSEGGMAAILVSSQQGSRLPLSSRRGLIAAAG